jgi:leader peptidase (prepilin peptidase)/N-methyltransferase
MNTSAAITAFATAMMLWIVVWCAARSRGTDAGPLPVRALVVTALIAACSRHMGPTAPLALAAASIAAVADVRTGLIFDWLTAIVVALGLTVAALHDGDRAALFGGLVTATPLLLLHLATNRRGLGFGDVKLAAGLGITLGVWGGLTAIVIAFVAGGAYGSMLLATRKATRRTAIRFGPFLATGTYVAVLTPAVLQ